MNIGNARIHGEHPGENKVSSDLQEETPAEFVAMDPSPPFDSSTNHKPQSYQRTLSPLNNAISPIVSV